MEIVEWIFAHKYISFFIGMVVGGDIVLITAIFLVLRNEMSFMLTIWVGTIATLFSDLLWYGLGYLLPKSSFVQRIIENKGKTIDVVRNFFTRHAYRVVFYSKFIYGTRTVVQILAGFNHLPLLKYFLFNAAGTLGYMALLFIVGFAVHETLDQFKSVVYGTHIAFIAFVIILIALRTLLKNIAIKKWFTD